MSHSRRDRSHERHDRDSHRDTEREKDRYRDGQRSDKRERRSNRDQDEHRHRHEDSHQTYRERDNFRERDKPRGRGREGDSKGGGGCYKCGQDGHFARECPNGGDSKGRGGCYKCGQDGHFARECPENGRGDGDYDKTKRIKVEKKDDNGFWSKSIPGEAKVEEKEKEKPNFGLTGSLAKDTNTFNGVVIKYNQPPEARKPKKRWRFYQFKNGEPCEPLFVSVHKQSAFLMGRDRSVVDIPTDHPSCSKQHAVLQYRLVEYERDDGSMGKRVKPYVIDLESSNGTFVNNEKIEAKRYHELFEKDVLKFGFSTREYVLLHEESKNDHEDDNVIDDETKQTQDD